MKTHELLEKTNQTEIAHRMVVSNLIATSNLVSSEYERFFKKYSISPEQYNVLEILYNNYPKKVSVGYVMERMPYRMSNTSRLVEKLKKKGFLNKHACRKDKRSVNLTLTGEGIAFYLSISKNINVIENKYDALSENETIHLNQTLNYIKGLFGY